MSKGRDKVFRWPKPQLTGTITKWQQLNWITRNMLGIKNVSKPVRAKLIAEGKVLKSNPPG